MSPILINDVLAQNWISTKGIIALCEKCSYLQFYSYCRR